MATRKATAEKKSVKIVKSRKRKSTTAPKTTRKPKVALPVASKTIVNAASKATKAQSYDASAWQKRLRDDDDLTLKDHCYRAVIMFSSMRGHKAEVTTQEASLIAAHTSNARGSAGKCRHHCKGAAHYLAKGLTGPFLPSIGADGLPKAPRNTLPKRSAEFATAAHVAFCKKHGSKAKVA